MRFVTLGVAMATMVSAQSAGRTAQTSFVTMVPSVTNRIPMVVELAQSPSATTARSGEGSGTLSAARTFTMSAAVSVRRTVRAV